MTVFGRGNDFTDLESLLLFCDLGNVVDADWGSSRVGRTGELGVCPRQNADNIFLGGTRSVCHPPLFG